MFVNLLCKLLVHLKFWYTKMHYYGHFGVCPCIITHKMKCIGANFLKTKVPIFFRSKNLMFARIACLNFITI